MSDDETYPFVYTCRHLHPHLVTIRDSVDHMALAMFREDGWEGAGYCLAYMPEWLRPRYERGDGWPPQMPAQLERLP